VLSKLDTRAAAKVVGVLEAADAADMLEKAMRFKRWDTQRVAAVLSACPPDSATRILGYVRRTHHTVCSLCLCRQPTREPNGRGEFHTSVVRKPNVLLPVRFC
jgi:hypothetical protein